MDKNGITVHIVATVTGGEITLGDLHRALKDIDPEGCFISPVKDGYELDYEMTHLN